MADGKDVGVALTFDYDALLLWIGTFDAKTSMTSRGELGVIGVRRILSTLAHYKIPGTFYIPGHTAYAFPKSVQDIAAAGQRSAIMVGFMISPRQFLRIGSVGFLKRGLRR